MKQAWIILVFLLAAGVCQAGDAQPLAVLMGTVGEVSVERGNDPLDGIFGLHLEAGDVVITGGDGSAEIMFSSGNWIKVDAGSRMGIQGSRQSSLPEGGGAASPSFDSVQEFVKLKDERGTSSLAMVRSGTDRDELHLMVPCQTKVPDGFPVFRWQATDSPPDVKLTIYGDASVHWQTEVVGATELAYPADAPPLEPGVAYSWSVETSDPLLLPPQRSRTGLFEVLPAEQAVAMTRAMEASTSMSAASDQGLQLVRASIYYQYGLMDEAIAATRVALQAQPQSQQLRSILARLLGETGRNQEALVEYDRLLKSN